MPPTQLLPYAHYEVKNQLAPVDLKGFSKMLLDQHWTLYKGYVTNVNLLNKVIWDALDSGSPMNEPRTAEVQRRLGFEYNGMIFHELYFESLKGKPAPVSLSSAVVAQMNQDFGGFERWKKMFMEIGKMRGVGWVVLAMDPSSHRLINLWVGNHEVGVVVGFVPLIVMDVWEHAYVTDYGSNAEGRMKYIDMFFDNLDWAVVSRRHALVPADAGKTSA